MVIHVLLLPETRQDKAASPYNNVGIPKFLENMLKMEGCKMKDNVFDISSMQGPMKLRIRHYAFW